MALLHSASTHNDHVIRNFNGLTRQDGYGKTSDGTFKRNESGRINSRVYWPGNNPIDICYAYSDDRGKTWSRSMIAIPYGADTTGTQVDKTGDVGNPCLGFDATSKTVWMLFRRGPDHQNAKLCCTKSRDNGKTWGFDGGELYRVISQKHYRPGPSTIIQIPPGSKSPHAGRLLLSSVMDRDGDHIGVWATEAGSDQWHAIAVIPNGQMIQKTAPLGDFVAGSPGDGQTWRARFDETDIFYCEANQTLYLSSRKVSPYTGPSRKPGLAHDIKEFGRYYLTSRDGGKTWSKPVEYYQYALPQCQQSHIAQRDVLLWFAPSGDHVKLFGCPSRTSFHCFASFDQGKSWDEALINIPPVEIKSPYYETTPYLDFGAYSVAARLSENTIGVLAERGSNYGQGGSDTYCNFTFYPLCIQYDSSMNTNKLKDIAKGRTNVFRNGRQVATFDKRSDINLLATYATKSKLKLLVGADQGLQDSFRGEIAEIIVFDKALDQDELDLVHRYVNDRYGVAATPARP